MKDGVQTLALGEGNTLTALPIEVAAGTTLDMGTSTLEVITSRSARTGIVGLGYVGLPLALAFAQEANRGLFAAQLIDAQAAA